MDLIKYAIAILNLDSQIPNKWSVEGVVIFSLLALIFMAILVWSIRIIFEQLVRLVDAGKKLGVFTYASAEQKSEIRRRKQFCEVLTADLAQLAKAESWNDQYFTDLEAEVEAEGGYYASRIDMLLRRQSTGLRRARSLIQAIETSTEQSLLLVGEPGSGKSVALRHLAKQLSVKASNSTDLDAWIPLYVNLKELPVVGAEALTTDFIKTFILENVRRGDADTAARVKEDWEKNCNNGLWFFLFDSFDEIPSVLHAPSGSPVIQQHAEAIRRFLAGQSLCRGVLASREFKGPEKLPWQRFRILSLSDEKQDELVDNAFLSGHQKQIVRQHLADNNNTIHRNPLFLTLLCRYVKEEGHAPRNDHDLLNRHIVRLSQRDSEHTYSHYGVTPAELMDGATRLSVLFAERKDLSLAPTSDEISKALEGAQLPGGKLDNLLAALVDVKIGRSDVQEARAGDQRFTFSHRRYQETLFVNHLAGHDGYIDPTELLTDLRWREYAVTLLQTQSIESNKKLLLAAETLLDKFSAEKAITPVNAEFVLKIGYFDWRDDPAVLLIELLQEGLARRFEIIPKSLSLKIEQLLEPRWDSGDAFDKLMVIKLGGLLPQQILCSRLQYAVDQGSLSISERAFRCVTYLRDVPNELAKWFSKRLATESMAARSRIDHLRLEALLARLPQSLNARYVYRRCRLLVKLTAIVSFNSFGFRYAQDLIHFVLRVWNIEQSQKIEDAVVKRVASINLLTSMYIASLIAPIIFVGSDVRPEYLTRMYLVFYAIYIFILFLVLILYSLRSLPGKLGMKQVFLYYSSEGGPLFLRMFSFLFVTLFVTLAIALVIALFLNLLVDLDFVVSYALSISMAPLLLILIRYFINLRNGEWFAMRRLRDARYSANATQSLVLQARSINELLMWLSSDNDNEILPTRAHIRSLLRILDAKPAEYIDTPLEKFLKGSKINSWPRLFRFVWTQLLYEEQNTPAKRTKLMQLLVINFEAQELLGSNVPSHE